MQRGFIALENLYNNKKAQVKSLQQNLQDKSAEYEHTVTALLDRLDKNEKKIGDLSAEVETRGKEVVALSTELEAARNHVQGSKTVTITETKESVSQVRVVHPSV